MWSKFTEYAEGIVEIVAQADAAAAATVSATDSQSSPVSSPSAASAAAVAAAPASAITGEEIWSRFTSIVAPPAAAIAAPLSQKRERQPRVVEEAPRSAPPSLDQLRKAQAEAQRLSTAAATVASQQQEPLSSSSKTIDEDEQEQYICELERALLQRKKQNEVLEKQVRPLYVLCSSGSYGVPDTDASVTCCYVCTRRYMSSSTVTSRKCSKSALASHSSSRTRFAVWLLAAPVRLLCVGVED